MVMMGVRLIDVKYSPDQTTSVVGVKGESLHRGFQGPAQPSVLAAP